MWDREAQKSVSLLNEGNEGLSPTHLLAKRSEIVNGTNHATFAVEICRQMAIVAFEQ